MVHVTTKQYGWRYTMRISGTWGPPNAKHRSETFALDLISGHQPLSSAVVHTKAMRLIAEIQLRIDDKTAIVVERRAVCLLPSVNPKIPLVQLMPDNHVVAVWKNGLLQSV